MTRPSPITPLISEIEATVLSLLDLSACAMVAHTDEGAIGAYTIALPQAEALIALMRSAIHITQRNTNR